MLIPVTVHPVIEPASYSFPAIVPISDLYSPVISALLTVIFSTVPPFMNPATTAAATSSPTEIEASVNVIFFTAPPARKPMNPATF